MVNETQDRYKFQLPAKEALKKANDCATKKKYDEAVKLYQKSIENYKKAIEITGEEYKHLYKTTEENLGNSYSNLGHSYMELAKGQNTEEYLKEAVKLLEEAYKGGYKKYVQNNLITSYYKLAVYYKGQDNFKESINLLLEAQKIDGKDIDVLYQLAVCYLDSKDDSNAKNTFEKVLQLKDNKTELILNSYCKLAEIELNNNNPAKKILQNAFNFIKDKKISEEVKQDIRFICKHLAKIKLIDKEKVHEILDFVDKNSNKNEDKILKILINEIMSEYNDKVVDSDKAIEMLSPFKGDTKFGSQVKYNISNIVDVEKIETDGVDTMGDN